MFRQGSTRWRTTGPTLLRPPERPQLDEGEFWRRSRMEGRIGGHQADVAGLDRRREIKAILNGVLNLEADGPSRPKQRFAGHEPDRAGGEVGIPQVACLLRPFEGQQ